MEKNKQANLQENNYKLLPKTPDFEFFKDWNVPVRVRTTMEPMQNKEKGQMGVRTTCHVCMQLILNLDNEIFFLLNQFYLRDFLILCNGKRNTNDGKFMRRIDYKITYRQVCTHPKVFVIGRIGACYSIEYAWYAHTHLLAEGKNCFFAPRETALNLVSLET